MLARCSRCAQRFAVVTPAGLGPGARVGAVCPACNEPMEICLSGPVPPPGGRPPPGRQRALLVGINYFGSNVQLQGCVNDVKNIFRLLTETYGWHSSAIRVLTDEERDPRRAPTKSNIVANLHWLANGDDTARPGDVLFLQLSGHGAQQEDPHGLEADGMNETFLPVDFKSAGMLSDDEISEVTIRPLPEFVKLTAVMDCCHSGTGLDLPFTHTSHGWRMETNPWFHASDVQLFSGCEDGATSADVSSRYGQAGGAMTTAFCNALRMNKNPSYPELLATLNRVMKENRFAQRPQLSSSQQFAFDRPFSLTDAVENRNPMLGRIVNQKFPPRPRPFGSGDPLGNMLKDLGGCVCA